ncbi:hypothetical protein PLESTM_001234200 [Pleodorina starrii]|nr:hypothetical protein PLESTM_001234200 [Pleodorina starrii]
MKQSTSPKSRSLCPPPPPPPPLCAHIHTHECARVCVCVSACVRAPTAAAGNAQGTAPPPGMATAGELAAVIAVPRLCNSARGASRHIEAKTLSIVSGEQRQTDKTRQDSSLGATPAAAAAARTRSVPGNPVIR